MRLRQHACRAEQSKVYGRLVMVWWWCDGDGDGGSSNERKRDGLPVFITHTISCLALWREHWALYYFYFNMYEECFFSIVHLLLLSFFHWALPLFRFVCNGYIQFGFFLCAVYLSVCVCALCSQLLVRIDFHCDKMWFTLCSMLSSNFRYQMKITNVPIRIKWKYRKWIDGKFAWDYLKIKNHWKIHYILVDRENDENCSKFSMSHCNQNSHFRDWKMHHCATAQKKNQAKTQPAKKKRTNRRISSIFNGKSFSCPVREIIETANWNALIEIIDIAN